MMRLRMLTVAAVAAAVLCATLPASAGGQLDTSFSGDGKVTTDVFGGNHDRLTDTAVDSSGRIVAVGSWGGGAVRKNFVLVRYLSSGAIDTSFGSGGIAMADFDGDDDIPEAVAIQPDGKIVVVGYALIGSSVNKDFAVARYLPSGKLDTTFSGDGKVTTDFLNREWAHDVAIQPDGRIVVAGWTDAFGGDDDFALVRYLSDGRLDTSFSRDGMQHTGLGADDYASAVTIQPDGKILAVGSRSEDDDSCFGCLDIDLAFARYRTDGTLDPTFDGDGKKTQGLGFDENIEGVHVMSDGRFYVGGRAKQTFFTARYHSNGSLDDTYGIEFIDFGMNVEAHGMGVQSDGKVVVGGSSGGDLAVARFTSTGADDTTFSTDGKVLTDFGGWVYGGSFIVQPNGRLLAGGYKAASGDDDEDFVLARYLP